MGLAEGGVELRPADFSICITAAQIRAGQAQPSPVLPAQEAGKMTDKPEQPEQQEEERPKRRIVITVDADEDVEVEFVVKKRTKVVGPSEVKGAGLDNNART